MSAAAVLILALTAQAPAITVSWDPNTEEDLAGYRIHYGTAPGSYSASVTVGPAKTSHQLARLMPETTYYVAMTAYDGSGNESGYSDEAHATILAGASTGWPSYRHEGGQPPVRQPWWPVYRKGD